MHHHRKPSPPMMQKSIYVPSLSTSVKTKRTNWENPIKRPNRINEIATLFESFRCLTPNFYTSREYRNTCDVKRKTIFLPQPHCERPEQMELKGQNQWNSLGSFEWEIRDSKPGMNLFIV